MCMRKRLSLLLVGWLSLTAWADIGPQLDSFNQAERQQDLVARANDFFRQLYEEQFIDTLLIYKAATPADTLREQVWYWAAEYCYDQQRFDQAVDYGLKALPLYQKGNDRTGESDCLNILAISNIRLSNYGAAIDYAKQCYRLDEASGDADRISASLNSLAGIYMSAHQPAEAEQYVLKGLQKAAEAGLDSRRAVLLGMASEVYHAMVDDEKALDYAEQSYELEKQLGHHHKALLRQAQKASALIGLERFEQAEQVLQTIIPLFRDAGDIHSLGISLNKMGMVQLSLKHEQEGVPYFREAAGLFAQMGDMSNEMHSRKGLYECLWKSQPDSARMELERFNLLKDSLYTIASAESLARYNAEFGNDWLQQENAAERSAKRSVMLTAIVVICLLLAFSLIVWLIMRRRHLRQTSINQQLSDNIEELREKYKELSVRYDNAIVTNADGNQRKDLSETDSLWLEKVVDVINDHLLNGQVDAESVASQLNMSLFQFRQRLTALTDETPQSFIGIIRMRRARYLLDNRPELNISEVAQLCAYNDTPNFTRAFKKMFGLTPTQYLEKQRKP